MRSFMVNERLKCIAMDYFTSLISFAFFNIIRYYFIPIIYQHNHLANYLKSGNILLEEIILPVTMLGIYWLSGYYNRPIHRSRIQEGLVTMGSSILISLLFFFVFLTNDMGQSVKTNLLLFASFLILNFIFVYAGRLLLTSLMMKRLWNKEYVIRTLMIGNSDSARKVEERLANTKSALGWDVVGYIDIPGEEKFATGKALGNLDEVKDICRKYGVDQCLVIPKEFKETEVLKILPPLLDLDIPIRVTADTFSIVTSGIRLQDIFSEPFVDITRPTLSDSGQNIKRTLDVALSFIALLSLAIPMMAITLGVLITSGRPIFYSQKRLGYKRKEFNIYKFRTMYADAEKSGPRLSHKDDDRITPFGHFLRKYRLDELPQFWNVLKGDMSIVGPRPEREFFAKKIQMLSPYYTLIHQVKPGITSWGMVKYGYASTVEEMVTRSRYDIIYLSSMSLTIDLKIMIYTIKTVITGRGV